jgi:hypothetical protein
MNNFIAGFSLMLQPFTVPVIYDLINFVGYIDTLVTAHIRPCDDRSLVVS